MLVHLRCREQQPDKCFKLVVYERTDMRYLRSELAFRPIQCTRDVPKPHVLQTYTSICSCACLDIDNTLLIAEL